MRHVRTAAKQHAWLVDCYRTRVDDDCGLRAREPPHGLGAAGSTAASIGVDFLQFCKLAVARGVVPPRAWDWHAFLLEGAAGMLPRAFSPEKSRPELRYGAIAGAPGELRRVVSVVYEEGNVCDQLRRVVRDSCWSEGCSEEGASLHMVTFDRNPAIFADVGGHQLWRTFLKRLEASL